MNNIDFYQEGRVANTAIIEKKITIKMPYDREIEQTLLGGLICDNANYNLVVGKIESIHFYEPLHQVIFQVIQDFGKIEKGFDCKAIHTLLMHGQDYKSFFDNKVDVIKLLKESGDLVYLQCLANNYILGVTNIEAITRDIVEYYQRRELLKSLGNLANNLYGNYGLNISPQGFMSDFNDKAQSVLTGIELTHGFTNVSDVTKEELEAAFSKKQIGIPTGIDELDCEMRGFLRGDLYTIAGRTGMGKTGFFINCIYHALNSMVSVDCLVSPESKIRNKAKFKSRQIKMLIKDGWKEQKIDFPTKVGFVSLEMPKYSIFERLIARFSEKPFSELGRDKIIQTWEKITKKKLFIKDCSKEGERRIERIKSSIRRLISEEHCDIVFIDHIGIIDAEPQDKKPRHEFLSDLTISLKELAKQLNIAIVVLAQLNKAGYKDDNKIPNLSDIKGSTGIIENSDVVIGIHREEYYTKSKEPQKENLDEFSYRKERAEWEDLMQKQKNKCTINFIKNRHGRDLQFNIDCDMSIYKFSSKKSNYSTEQ